MRFYVARTTCITNYFAIIFTQLWNCQWLADFALLEGKDWKDFFISSGCDVSQISVIPKPVKPETIVEELGPFVRCALRIAQS